MSITYAAALPVNDETVLRVAALLYAERVRRNTRSGRRALTCQQQAVFFLRWLLDGTRMSQLVRDNGISTSTGYERLHETTTVLAAHAPDLHCALLAAKAAGYDYVLLDGTLIETDRVSTPGPTAGVDLWWSKKHKNHGGNIQVLCAPDGWPLWTSPVRHGREHDTTCLRTHPGLPETLAQLRDDLRTLTDLGYEGETGTVVVTFKKPRALGLVRRSCWWAWWLSCTNPQLTHRCSSLLGTPPGIQMWFGRWISPVRTSRPPALARGGLAACVRRPWARTPSQSMNADLSVATGRP
jgi:hypothetical protein